MAEKREKDVEKDIEKDVNGVREIRIYGANGGEQMEKIAHVIDIQGKGGVNRDSDWGIQSS